MSVIMVAIIDIEDEDKYLEYQNKVLPMFEELGVDVLAVAVSYTHLRAHET